MDEKITEVQEYIIISNSSAAELAAEVNRKIKLGYKPLGAPFPSQNLLLQAMTQN